MPDGATQVLGVRLFDRLPGHIYSGLTAEQKTEIAKAASESPWRQQPIDLRLTVRLPFGPYYLRLIAGQERRNESRLRLERTVQPLRTARNMTFIISGALVFYGVALATMLLLSSVVEF
jgi:hypothetical protein